MWTTLGKTECKSQGKDEDNMRKKERKQVFHRVGGGNPEIIHDVIPRVFHDNYQSVFHLSTLPTTKTTTYTDINC